MLQHKACDNTASEGSYHSVLGVSINILCNTLYLKVDLIFGIQHLNNIKLVHLNFRSNI